MEWGRYPTASKEPTLDVQMWREATNAPILEDEPREPKMYLILREDLAFKYIQGSHALAQFANDYPKQFKEWNNQILICLSVFNVSILTDLVCNLEIDNIEFSPFYEPDLGDVITAIAHYGTGECFDSIRMATR